VTEADPGPPSASDDEAHARRLYRRALVWGVLTLVFLWWFARHWKA
jgi:hypothetical protein